MPSRFYMQVEGAKQGNIKGECKRSADMDWIECLAFDHEVSTPRDPHTGQATGHRQHHLMTVTKEFDTASPLLFKALVENEVLTKVEIKWYRPEAGTGKEVVYFTVTLSDAYVASVKPWIPNVLDPEHKSYTNMENVSFVYSKIIWKHVAGSKEAQDDWYAGGA